MPQSSLMPVRCISSLNHFHHGVEVLVGLRERLALGGDVAVVEAEERGAEFFHELEGDADAMDRVVHGVIGAFPRPEHGAGPEGIAARAPHRVPVGDAETKVVFHRLAGDDFVFVVVAEGQGIGGFRTLERIFWMSGKAGMNRLLGKGVMEPLSCQIGGQAARGRGQG